MDILSYKHVDGIVGEKLNNFFPVPNSFVEVNPGRVFLPKKYMEIGEQILNVPIYEDDCWLVSYPRTGATWAQEMVWLLGNGLDFEGAKKIQQIRAPLLELTALFSEDHHEWVKNSLGNSVEWIKNLPRPRFVRSHLPWHLLPLQLDEVKPKVMSFHNISICAYNEECIHQIIYTARNPKDLCVSFYHYCKLVHGLCGSLEDFCELFIAESSPVGSYWSHVLPFWERRNDSNVLFIKYEHMKRNLSDVIRQCADFLNIDYKLTQEKMDKICAHLNFEKMQSNPAVNLDPIINPVNNNCASNIDSVKFIRKGQIGDWKNHISPELSEKFDRWTKLHTGGTGLDFEYV